jgi:hypothetical protein
MALPRPHRPSHATVVAYLALVVAVGGGTAFAATGGSFVIGKANQEATTTSLTRTTAGAPLSLVAKAGSAPLAVSSTVKVAKLNADLLDGKDSTAFQPKITYLTFTPLTPIAGWMGNCFTGNPGIAISADGVVHFRGDVCAVTSPAPNNVIFNIPAKFRPTQVEYVPVDECGSTTGRLRVYPNGDVYADADRGSTPDLTSECFVSLAGVTYTLPF